MSTAQTRQSTESRQAEIVATLVRLSADCSAAEITTTDIARAMQLTQGALFRHFPNKEAIRLAVAEWIEDALLSRLLAARQGAASPLDALHAMFMAHVAFVVEHPGVPRLVFGELQQPRESPLKRRVCQLLQRYRTLLAEVLDEAAAAGLVRADLERPAAAALFVGAIQGLVIQSMFTETTQGLKAQAAAVFDLYRLGLAAKS